MRPASRAATVSPSAPCAPHEQGSRQPEAAARIPLKVIEKRPDAVAEALGA
ncbi:MAG: hypothetical protein ABL957_02030 [Parvularculaceae bacterium]